MEPFLEDPIFNDLEPVLEVLEPVHKVLGPVLKDLGLVLEDFERVLQDLGPVLEGSGPVLEDLGRVLQDLGQSSRMRTDPRNAAPPVTVLAFFAQNLKDRTNLPCEDWKWGSVLETLAQNRED